LFDFDSLDDIDPTATDDEAHAPLTDFDAEIVTPSDHAHGHQVSNEPPQVVGCAFGGGRSDELPDIPMRDAIEALHREAKKIEAIG
jgi:hypothetical protein